MRFFLFIIGAATFAMALGCTGDIAPEQTSSSSSSSSSVEQPAVQLVSLKIPGMK